MEARPATQPPTGAAGRSHVSCPDGLTGPPDFVGAAQRPGTTWWCPEITASQRCSSTATFTEGDPLFNGQAGLQRIPDHYADLYPRTFRARRTRAGWRVDAALHARSVGHEAAASGGSRCPHPADARDPVATIRLRYERRMAQERGAGGSHLGSAWSSSRCYAASTSGRCRRVLDTFPREVADVSARWCLDYKSQLDRPGVSRGRARVPAAVMRRDPAACGGPPRVPAQPPGAKARRRPRRGCGSTGRDRAGVDLSLWPSAADLARLGRSVGGQTVAARSA